MADRPPIAIVGPGKVGTALGILARRAGWPVAAVGGGSPGRAAAAAAAIGGGARALAVGEAAAAGELVLLTVPDGAIADVCRRLAEGGALPSGGIVAHCCGAMGSDVLACARSCSCAVGSMHPLQTFPTVAAAVAKLPGAYCFVEGDAAAADVLEALARAVGCRAVRIEPSAKVLYHAAAVTACNYLAALLDAALAMGRQAGIERAVCRQALAPLVRATAENVTTLGPEAALTGPIARGDVETVRRHVEALATHPPAAELYRALGRWTVDLAVRKGTLAATAAAQLRELLR